MEPNQTDKNLTAESGLNLIEAYGAGGFRVAGRRIEGSLYLAPGRLESLAVASFSDLTEDKLMSLLEGAENLEILLVGTGESLEFLTPSLRQRLEKFVGGVDSMDTGAAARTYNVLALESRRVAAVLIAVD